MADSGRDVFLKRPCTTRATQTSQAKALLVGARALFSRIRHPSILQPLFVDMEPEPRAVYPYLSPERWQPLSPQRFRESYEVLLPGICAVLDFIHAMGVVHCDLKAEHFMISTGSRQSLLLIDFDFAQLAGTRPDKIVAGTLSYIAPELLLGHVILPQSDHYSLGVMLLDLIAAGSRKERGSLHEALENGLKGIEIKTEELPEDLRRVARFAKELVKRDPLERPDYLGSALEAEFGFSEARLAAYDKKLIWDSLKSWYLFGLRAKRRVDLTEVVRENAKLIGVPAEVLRDAQLAISKSPLAVTRSLRGMLQEAEQEYLGDFWRLQFREDQLRKFYSADWLREHFRDEPRATTAGDRRELYEYGLAVANRGEVIKALTVLRPLADQPEPAISEGNTAGVQTEVARLYKSLGYVQLANQYYERSLESNSLSPEGRATMFLELADMNVGGENFARRMKFLDAALAQAEASGLEEIALHIRIRKLTFRRTAGDPAGCLVGLQEIKDYAAAKGLELSHARACNMLATTYVEMGKALEARQLFLEGLQVAAKVDRISLRIALLNNLASAELDLGDYSNCIEHAEQALKLTSESNDPVRAAFAHRVLSSCYAFLGEYSNAERHISQYLSINIVTGNQHGIGLATLRWGWIEFRRSRFDKAQSLLLSARRLLAKTRHAGFMARADLYLGMIESRRSNFDQAEELISTALRTFRELDDSLMSLDAEFELFNIDAERRAKPDLSQAASVLQRCIDIGYRFGVAKGAFLLLSRDSYFAEAANWELLGTAKSLLEQDLGTLSAATLLLFRYREARAEGDAALDILKEAFTSLVRAEQLPEAIPVALLLSKEYQQSNPKLAAAFLNRVAELQAGLGNAGKKAEAEKKLKALKQRTSETTGTLTALVELSSLLNSLADYRHVLNKILETALRLTGAERAVLLIADRADGKLRVEAASECDTQSLKDIAAISNTVVKSVYDSREPCLINDATQNESTRGYKSIIMHNILSVACIPLVLQGSGFGALYLDHHTLSGLFTSEDHRLMDVLGNFVAIAVDKARHLRNLKTSVSQASKQLEAHGIRMPIITEDPTMLKLLGILPTIARADTPVLILGESGTGKELIAELIHREGNRADGPFVMLNCSTLEGSLLESELFGVAKKAVTDVLGREGKFEAADGGTVFLDEIAEMPINTQAKLLRVLEGKGFERLGSNETIQVEFKLVAATNANLKELIAAGKFRQDLYYRIQTVELLLPPLRERPSDIMLLIEHFLQV
ncbi:MAG: sigma 54-interacting transcriptional regulator, partial [bacterium]